MLSVSQTTGYAILALSNLDPDRERWVLEKDIAEETGISKPYLTKLLHRLGGSGLIETKRGNKGGIKLAKHPVSISVMDIFIAVEGEDWKNRCLMGLPNCGGDNPCPMHEFWLKERGRIIHQFETMTLDVVIDFHRRGWRMESFSEMLK
ncbi:Rrf2 family transcriptional regulator [bacterium]|nr:Rrf2 family transcriptional regulator [bacterium]